MISKLEKWARGAELFASLAVVASLIFLVVEVRNNTRMVERQIVLQRAQSLNGPFLAGADLPNILTKIKAVDGSEPIERALVTRYRLTYGEAGVWARYLALVWTGLEADYLVNGESSNLERWVRALISFPDAAVFWDNGAGQVADTKFRAYVERVRRSKPAQSAPGK